MDKEAKIPAIFSPMTWEACDFRHCGGRDQRLCTKLCTGACG